MAFDISVLNEYVKELGICFSDNQLNQFLAYYNLLISWNEKINLTTITDFDDVLKKHFLDSVAIVKAVDCDIIKDITDNASFSLIDVGCGAGFPSVPLKIAFPELQVTCLDSLNKRINFLNEVFDELHLSGIRAVHGRAEDAAADKSHREAYDIAVSRAVANMSTLSEYCLPFVKQGGILVAYKSEELVKPGMFDVSKYASVLGNNLSSYSDKSELDISSKAIKLLGGHIENVYEYTLPSTDFYRSLCVVRKSSKTSSRYPRKAGLPSKEPIL